MLNWKKTWETFSSGMDELINTLKKVYCLFNHYKILLFLLFTNIFSSRCECSFIFRRSASQEILIQVQWCNTPIVNEGVLIKICWWISFHNWLQKCIQIINAFKSSSQTIINEFHKSTKIKNQLNLTSLQKKIIGLH